MERFYFTYGTEGQPYRGGWTVIWAPDRKTAYALFRAVHPDKTEGVLNCACVYTAEHFRNTKMWENGNFGKRCHEVIEVTRTVSSRAERKGGEENG